MNWYDWYLKVLKQYVDFKGRARREEYWMFFLFNTIISFVLQGIDAAIDIKILSSIYSLATLLPSIAVGVRRMHDVGKSGWFLLIPIYNLILACTDSEKGENKWGENPKGEGNQDEINEIGTE